MEESQKIKLTYAVDENFNNDKFMKLRLKVCHNARSLNNTKFTTDSLVNAESTISNIPILAYIYENDKGELEMGEHDFKIEEDRFEEGALREIFLEQPVGLIPENNNYEVVEEDGICYAYCDGYIWKGYSNYCVDLLKASDRIKLSMEVNFLNYNYSRAEDCYVINDFEYLGITLLGEQHRPAMQNSGATIVNYSASDNNANVTLENMRHEMKKIFTANDINKEGEIKMDRETIDSILAELGVTESELDFEITEDMTEEELRSKIQEYIDSKSDNSASDSDEPTLKTPDEPATDNSATDTPAESSAEPIDDKYTVTFSMSYEDKRQALYAALEEKTDDECWICETYDSYVVIQKWIDGKYYKVNYSEDNGTITIDDNFIEVFNLFLTEDEKAIIEQQRSNYAALEAEVESLREFKETSDNAAKEEIFSAFDEVLGEAQEYSAIKESMKNYSVTELEEKCYALLGKQNAKFSLGNKDNLSRVTYSAKDNITTLEKSDEGIFDTLLY